MLKVNRWWKCTVSSFVWFQGLHCTLNPRALQRHVITTLQNAASSEVSTQNVLCTQNGIYLRCVGTHKVCTYHKVSICPKAYISQSVYILLEVWYMHKV